MMTVTEKPCIPPEKLLGSNYTTYKIGGPMDEAYQPATLEEAISVLHYYRNRKIQEPELTLTTLGWGGNTLIASAGIRGITLITRKMGWVTQLDDTSFEFGCGVHLAKAATVALTHHLTGGEFMIGIPGTVGGAVRMNAGALGQETANVVRAVTVFNLQSGEIQKLSRDALQFSYRKSSICPDSQVVLSAEMTFQPGDYEQIKTTMDKSVHFRRTHHPIDPNGGSVFKNPAPDKPVGRLIEELGGKGWQEGGVQVSPLHGNFIVNVNQGTSLDVLKLMLRMKLAIQQQFGLSTHPENLLIGELTPEEKDLWQKLNQA